MIGLNVLFWIFIILFAMIGMMRGWAKEMLVSFGVILALFLITVTERYLPFITALRGLENGVPLFWYKAIVLTALVFFGYQGPNIPKLAATGRFARDRLQDTLLGICLGALNGYLIFGSLWYFLNEAKYPFPTIIMEPTLGSPIQKAIADMVQILPPTFLGTPAIYFAVGIAFVFVIVVFL
jgi:uncharacterized membrane protein required for colicin V production